jgi:hypothetical protein
MTADEFSNQFDVLYSNITSNQAPGLTEYEKSVFLTKAQDEIVKNYFTANSKGNNIGQGFDDSAKRQADFATLIKNFSATLSLDYANSDIFPTTSPFIWHGSILEGEGNNKSVPSITNKKGASTTIKMPSDMMCILNETTKVRRGGTLANGANAYTGGKDEFLVTVPIRYDEYDRLASKPFKRPLKNQAWRMISSADRVADIVIGPSDYFLQYICRYVRKPKPIIVGDLDELTIGGYEYGTSGTNTTSGCELDSIIHEDILQRAVELAKVAWTATGQDNVQLMMQAGQRSE